MWRKPFARPVAASARHGSRTARPSALISPSRPRRRRRSARSMACGLGPANCDRGRPGGGIMTPAEMEQMTTSTQGTEVEPAEAAEPYSPPPALRRPRTRSAWTPIYQGRERRWWTIALAGTLLVTALGVGLLYMDDASNQATIRSLNTSNESLTGRNQILNNQLATTQANLTATLGELATTKAELEHPQVVIWTLPQQLKGANWYLAGGIPDTFTYHLKATSTGPMSISILTLEQWAKAIECVDNGIGPTNYCM